MTIDLATEFDALRPKLKRVAYRMLDSVADAEDVPRAGRFPAPGRAGFINGLPGFVTLEAGGELQTTALEVEDGKIAAIHIVRNPDKLRPLH